MNNKYVKKAAGNIEPFSKKKLSRFLRRIQVPKDQIVWIVDQVQQEAGEEIYTTQISDLTASKILQIENGEVYAARYNLKRDIRKMGPAGHIFEKYVGRLFEADGFDVQVAILVKGECVQHEIDAYATKGNELHLVESKFHNREGTRSDVTTALYVYARFLDIKEQVINKGQDVHVWIATNTKLTSTAFRYASCKGMHLLSVEQPHNNSIMDRVIRSSLFPISSLDILDPYLEGLFNENVVVLSDLLKLSTKNAKRLGLQEDILNQAQMQAAKLLDFTTKVTESTVNP